MPDEPRWWTLREIDERSGSTKGAAFRAFKRRLPELREGQDFRVLDHRRDGGEGTRLQATGRAYRSSVTLVLLHPRLAAELLTALTAPPDGD